MQSRLMADYRNFYYHLDQARIYSRAKNIEKADKNYTMAIESLKSLTINEGDYREAAETYHEFANFHFNRNNYTKAAELYEQGIQCLMSIEKINCELTDKDYRNFVELFIDLSDARMHLFNQNAADEAFSNAIKAFNLIKHKNDKELKAAKAKDSCAAIRALFEEKLSTKTYLKSIKFKNHGELLYQNQKEREVENMLGEIAVSTEWRDEKQLDDMMEGLSFTSTPIFSGDLIQKEPDDAEYRLIANQFFSLAKDQYSQQLIDDAIETLMQACSALQQVSIKNENDYQMINHIEANIQQLREQQRIEQSRQQPSSSTSGIGLFARNNSEENYQAHDDNSIARSSSSYWSNW